MAGAHLAVAPTRLVLASIVLLAPACRTETGRLTAAQEQRFETEGVRHRADNLRFRYTFAGTRGGTGWEDRLASIIVTPQTVLIHKNEKVGIEITPRSRRYYAVHRDGRRVRISAGSGRSAETWSFEPPEDPEGWTQDIRAVIRASKSSANDP
ncbi:MAG TPA: hypothetical protein VFK09_11610 [Gemmatimonadales bacterium]|nr:hypothetical protein [Gemmatimonadales bacterium]